MPYAQVLLPLALDKTLTYALSTEQAEKAAIGQRVAVLIKNKVSAGIVVEINKEKKEKISVSQILEILDEEPVVGAKEIDFWKWIAAYYASSPGQVMKAALPGSFNLDSETKISLNKNSGLSDGELTDEELLVKQALENNETISAEDLGIILGRKNSLKALKQMIERGLVQTAEQYSQRYKPRYETFFRLQKDIKEALELASKSEKQQSVLLALYSLSPDNDYVNKKALVKKSGESPAVIDALVKKGILESRKLEVSRIAEKKQNREISRLSKEQEKALSEIENGFEENKTVLLHGVTGSGKTEIYARLIEKTLAEGRQVLYLLPEIALTTQLIQRLSAYFGDRVGVYHSRFSDTQRAELWNRTAGKGKRYDIILGARSAVFLPFERLGLVIVDEEHDQSFKQTEPAPRYNARDAAIVLAKQRNAKALLGSATPSLESYYNAKNGKYTLVELKNRYKNVELPEFFPVDIKTAYVEKKMKGHFSKVLIDLMEEAVKNREQVIIFQNRRGFSPMVECRDCGYVPQCEACAVSLTYHKHSHLLRCHYCGFSQQPPELCPKCSSKRLDAKGFGTEQAEMELKKLFPDARIERMDYDSTKSNNAYFNIISRFENRQTDILVGTQMLSKGLDFDGVSLVGILNADNILSIPDFRAVEKGFQLLTQVSGRAGRKKRGKVVLQTYDMGKPVIEAILKGDYDYMYEMELAERKKYFYPPFSRMIKIIFRHKDSNFLDYAAENISSALRSGLGDKVRILGPDYHYIPKINNYYIKYLYLKIPPDVSSSAVKKYTAEIWKYFSAGKEYRSLRFAIDVDSA